MVHDVEHFLQLLNATMSNKIYTENCLKSRMFIPHATADVPAEQREYYLPSLYDIVHSWTKNEPTEQYDPPWPLSMSFVFDCVEHLDLIFTRFILWHAIRVVEPSLSFVD